MSKMKRFAEQISAEIGGGGELSSRALKEADSRLKKKSYREMVDEHNRRYNRGKEWLRLKDFDRE